MPSEFNHKAPGSKNETKTKAKNAAREIARPKRTAPQCYIFGSLNQVRFSEPHDHYLCFNFKSKDITTRAPRGYPDFCELLRTHRRTIDGILVGEGKRELRHRFAHIWQGDPNLTVQPTPQPTAGTQVAACSVLWCADATPGGRTSRRIGRCPLV